MMAITKAKRSIQKKQFALSSQRSAKTPKTKKQNHTRSTSRTYFPHAKGRVIKQVEFFSEPENNTLELTFGDDTTLSFEFQPSFVWEAYFSRWKSGDQRILHRWPPKNTGLR
jgi:hypothetical protein